MKLHLRSSRSLSSGRLALTGCHSDSTAKHQKAAAKNASAAQQVYVPPGKLDDYYAILSGGQSGSVFVYGIPSCRFIKEIADLRAARGLGLRQQSRVGKLQTPGGHRPALGGHAPSRCSARRTVVTTDAGFGSMTRPTIAWREIDLRTFEVAEIKSRAQPPGRARLGGLPALVQVRLHQRRTGTGFRRQLASTPPSTVRWWLSSTPRRSRRSSKCNWSATPISPARAKTAATCSRRCTTPRMPPRAKA